MNAEQLGRLYPYFGLLILLLGLLRFRVLKRNVLISLPVYMTVMVLLNLYSEQITRRQGDSRLLGNWIIIPLNFLYFFVLYYFFTLKTYLRRLIWILGILYLLFWLADACYFHPHYVYLYSRSYTAGVMALLIITVTFFYELLISDKLLRFYQVPGFWIGSGILVFYVGSLPFHMVWNYTANNFMKAFYTNKINFYLLLYLAYSCYAASIICLPWKKN